MPGVFVPIPNAIELVVKGVFESQQIANVLHYRNALATVITPAILDAFLELWWNTHNTGWLNCHSNAYTVYELTARDLTTEFAANAIHVVTDGTGTGPSPAAPGSNAGVISWATGVAGRSGKGRTYIGPWAADAFVGNSLVAPALGALTSLAGALMGSTEFGGLELGVASRKLQVINSVLSFAVDALVDSQRRRLSN